LLGHCLARVARGKLAAMFLSVVPVGRFPRPQWAFLGALLLAAVQLLGSVTSAQMASSVPYPCSNLESGPQRTVTRIIDGETVALDDGTELRMIGALAPRALDVGAEAGRWPMEVAALAELRALLLGRSIEIAFAGERTDRHGRLQGHAFWRDGSDLRWAQAHMLEQGLARAYVASGHPACARELVARERAAREARRGLWAEAAYEVRRADRPADLARYVSTFQVIEGRVVRVAQVRGVTYLNFDRDWRTGFSASLRRSDLGLLGGFAERPAALESRLVRVRGWVEEKPAPSIDLSSAGLFEIIDDGEAPAGALDGGPRRSSRGRASPSGPLEQAPEPRHDPNSKVKPPGLVETGR
jgi:micrococcal nuclease